MKNKNPIIPLFTPAQKTFLKLQIFENLTNNDILTKFKAFFFPNNDGYCKNSLETSTFYKRMSAMRKRLDKSQEYKDLMQNAQKGIAKKNNRIQARKKQISSTLLSLGHYDGRVFNDFTPIEKEDFKTLKNLLLKELKDLAIEQGEFKTSNINVAVDARKQFFDGRAVIQQLPEDRLKELTPNIEDVSFEELDKERDEKEIY